jgi:predicted RecA/RadA family phage recombinase
MTTTVETRTRQTLTAMCHRHEAERKQLADQLLAEEKQDADRLRAAFNPEAGAAIASALADVERQLRADHRTGNLHAVQVADLPSWASTDFPALDAGDRAEGRRRVIVHIPRQYADGHRDPISLAVIDVSDAIFGAGSRSRVDQALAARVREMEAERERDARDRERDASRR